MAKELKPHIGIFGRTNTGKSSLINAIAGQDVAIVADLPGTTTDPVKKSVEIFGIGPVVFIDTAGLGDLTELGQKRIKKTIHTIQHIDLAILVITENIFDKPEIELIEQFHYYKIPYIIVYNKNDIININTELYRMLMSNYQPCTVLSISTYDLNSIPAVIQAIKQYMPETAWKKKTIIGDLIQPNDLVLLIIPIDNEAPEGRLILPQVQVVRDILDNNAVALVLKETELQYFLNHTAIIPKLAITDSSIFNVVDKIVPKHIPLTGFSIVLARHKGPFEKYIEGTYHLENLKNGDTILLLESCTHQVTCEDIGRIKLPQWITQYTKKKLSFEIIAGNGTISKPIEEYSLVIQCGSCMITNKQVKSRIQQFIDHNIPVTNYGLAIAYLHGTFERSIKPFVKK